jgi:hypothetical protein
MFPWLEEARYIPGFYFTVPHQTNSTSINAQIFDTKNWTTKKQRRDEN